MPEAFAVLAVFFVVVAAWFGAWLHARNPANHNPIEDAQRLRMHADWLAERLTTARREKWGGEMVANLTIELNATSEQVSRSEAHLGKRVQALRPKIEAQEPTEFVRATSVASFRGVSLANMRSNASMCSRAFLKYASSSSQN